MKKILDRPDTAVHGQSTAESMQEQHGLSEEMLKADVIEGTPFTLVENTESKEYFVSLGNYRISRIDKDKEEVLKSTELNWDNILLVMGIVSHKTNELINK